MTQLTHYRFIDALRGFAFLGVLSTHVGGLTHPVSKTLANLADAGQYGVQLFFLLSAVTLLRSFALRSPEENFPVRNFFIRRLFRIAPLFWLGIVFYVWLFGCGPDVYAPNGIGVWHIASTASFLHGWYPTTINSVVPGGWSIAVEMTFYLCLPYLAGRLTSAWAAGSVFLYSLLAAAVLFFTMDTVLLRWLPPQDDQLIPWFLTMWFPSQLPVFLLGFVVYHALRHDTVMQFLAVPGRPALLACAAVYGVVALSSSTAGLLIPNHVFYSLVFALGIMVLAARPFPVVVNPLTCGLGVISFSCYLTHFAALKLTAQFILPAQFARMPPSMASFLYFAAVWLATLALTIALSALTYWTIEKPGIYLGNRIIRRWEPLRPRGAA